MRRRLALALLLPLLAGGAQAAPFQDQATPADVQQALAEGDLERAHALLTRLLVADRLDRVEAARAGGEADGAWALLRDTLRLAPDDARARALRETLGAERLADRVGRARELLAAANPRDAMVLLDEALEVDARDATLQFLRGECSLRMGIEDGNVFGFNDARDAFVAAARSGRAPAAWAGAGRALFQLYGASLDPNDLSKALEYARRGAEETDAGDPLAALLSYPPRRNHAEIAFFAYISARTAGQDATWVAARFDEARAAIEACIGDAPEDPWAWLELSKLWQWEENVEEERAVLERALELLPADSDLLARLADHGRRTGGYAESERLMSERVDATPEVAIARWYLGVEALELALERLLAGETDLDEAFTAAEAAFARCRELEPEYDAACRGREALCRSGLGWARYNRGDVEGARAAFLSMADVIEGGLAWEYPGKLLSGLVSLRFVVGKDMERAGDRSLDEAQRTAAWNSAADLATRLFEASPQSSDLANDAGFVNRDAGVALQQAGERHLARALGLDRDPEELTDAQRAAERARAGELFARAREVMERSYTAYVAAAELAADDARIVNDAGLILAYYLQRELDAARDYFRRAIEVGQAELERGVEDAERRAYVTEAVGDAHQNLGVLALTLEGDAAAARPEFERSVEIGPRERPEVSGYYLPLCDLLAKGAVDAELVRRANVWGTLELESMADKLRAAAELRRRLREAND